MKLSMQGRGSERLTKKNLPRRRSTTVQMWLRSAGLAVCGAGLLSSLLAQIPNNPAANGSGAELTAGQSSGTPLTLQDAVQRGLRTNLDILLSRSSTRQARAQLAMALSGLLPNIRGGVTESDQEVNLAAYGFSMPGFPQIVGPFKLFDARLYGHAPVFDLAAWERRHAAAQGLAAAREDYQEARQIVTVAVTQAYYLAEAGQSRVAADQASLNTAAQEFGQSRDMEKAGTTSAISVVRANVERDRAQQQLLADENALAKERMQLARLIGLPPGQRLRLTSPLRAPHTVAPQAVSAVIAQALLQRPDYRAAQDQVKSAKAAVTAAHAEHLPTLSIDGNYGTIGHSINSNHPTFTVAGTAQMELFAGGRIHADVLAAQARLGAAEARANDMRAAVEQQVRGALLDLKTAEDQVDVATRARDLAQQELHLAEDRFHAGVADNLEEVQAQQQVALSNENYITSLYELRLAQAHLEEALGVGAH